MQAGIGGELNPVAELSVEGWRRVIEVNLSGVFYAMRAQIPRMLEAGGGAIVNMTSILGQVGTRSAAGYVAAKHGIVGLTRSAALEVAPLGIRVNAVAPGFVDTPLLDPMRPGLDLVRAQIPAGRFGEPEEVAELVRFLAGPESSYCFGEVLTLTGGL